MAHPWIFESNFELGTNADWDSETTSSPAQLDFPHYSELARFPWATCAPNTGAYCMRLALIGGTADAYLVEGDIDIAANTTRYVKFDIWFSPTFTGTADDTFNIFEALATSTVEATFGARIVASTNVINLGIGETAPTSFSGQALERNVWHTVELTIDIDNNGSNDGTIDLFVTRTGDVATTAVSATQVASLDQGAVTTARLGIQDHAATTTGVILIDNFIFDDARVFPGARYSLHPIFTKSGHAFVGPGHLDIAGLLTDEANNILRLWDTDIADTNSTQSFVVELDINGTFTSFAGPIKFQNGCYVELSGTDPRGEVILTQASDRPGVLGPRYHSDAGVRRLGLQG